MNDAELGDLQARGRQSRTMDLGSGLAHTCTGSLQFGNIQWEIRESTPATASDTLVLGFYSVGVYSVGIYRFGSLLQRPIWDPDTHVLGVYSVGVYNGSLQVWE